MKSIPIYTAILFSALFIVTGLQSGIACAHEYWLQPSSYQLEKGEQVKISLKNGVDFKGTSFPYIGNHIVSFEISNREGKSALKGRDGDIPAKTMSMDTEGLNAISYYNKGSDINFPQWEKFSKYIEEEGAKWVLDRHVEKGLPQSDVREIFSRCAKTLIMVGNDAGSHGDGYSGMPAELVANENPYGLAKGKALSVTLLWEGQPLADNQVKIFEKKILGDNQAQELRQFKLRTDAEGLVSFVLVPGAEYLLSSVVLRESGVDDTEDQKVADWESFWASLTFRAPE